MRLFSQRKGIKPIKNIIQVDSMDKELRNRLWNGLSIFYWNIANEGSSILLSYYADLKYLCIMLWNNFFKYPLDDLENYWPNTYKKIKEFFFNCEWYDVYDFIEFIANNYEDESVNQAFIIFCNSVLESELSAYRFVDKKVTQITSEEEISEIEEALEVSKPLKAVNTHLRRSLELLADKKNPDYRNSIKESISAIESICKIIANDKKATLKQALKKIESKVKLHPALKKAFNNLYGYTSDAQGIRHSLLDESKLNLEDAKLMLVSCSTFINYLITKASKAGIKM